MIDVHCHILPDVDDGAADFSDARRMGEILVEHGFQKVFSTPHVIDQDGSRLSRDILQEKARALNAFFAQEGIPLEVLEGAEYYMDRALYEMFEVFHPFCTLSGSNYLLLELPVLNWPPYVTERSWPDHLEEKEMRKVLPFIRPIIAHPERYAEVLRNPAHLKELRESGYLFQVNLESIMGLEGKQSLKLVKKMAKEGLIDLVGTDGHSPEGLSRLLPRFRKKAEKILGKRAGRVLEENPALIVENKVIELER